MIRETLRIRSVDRHFYSIVRALVISALVGGAAACDCLSPTAPTSARVTDASAAPTGTSAATLVDVTVTGKTSIMAGETTPLTATASYSDGVARTVTTEAQWLTDTTGVCTLNAGGALTGVAAGTCRVSALYAQAAGRFTLTITSNGDTPPAPPTDPTKPDEPRPQSLALGGASSVAVGATTAWTATVRMTDGTTRVVTAASAWASIVPAIATVSPSGIVVGQSAGTATITAYYQGLAASGQIVVTPPPPGAPTVAGLTVTGNASMPIGQSSQLQAVAQMSDGTSVTVTTSASWAAGNGAIAAVQAGLVTGQGVGSTPITATYSGHSAGLTAVITAPPPGAPIVSSLSITGSTSIATGQTSQLQAVAQMTDGSSAVVTGASAWASATPAVATVAGGLVTGVSAGSSAVTATYGGQSAQAVMSVSPAPATLTGLDAEADVDLSTLDLSQAVALHVYGVYSDGSRQEVTNAAAYSSDSPLVHVNPDGTANLLLTAIDALTDPTHVINVSYGGFTTAVNLTVKTPVAQALSVGSGGTLSLHTGSQMPTVQALFTQGGQANLDADFPGVEWTMQPRSGAAGSLLNTALNLMGAPLNQVLTVADGRVSVVNNSLLNALLANPLLGGLVPVDVQARFQGINSNLQPATIGN
jgi:hypothetical protein